MAPLWPDLMLFILLFILFVCVLALNRITLTHKVYLAFHFIMMLWPFGQIAAEMAADPGDQAAFVKLSFSALSLLGPGWLAFVTFLTGRGGRLNRRQAIAALIPSAVCIAFIIWNPSGLFMTQTGDTYGDRVYGPLFWVMVVTEFVYFMTALILMFQALKMKSSVNQRRQLAAAVVGISVLTGFSAMDMLVNVLLAPWLPVIPGLMSFGIFLSDCCFVTAIYRYGAFDLLSIAQRDLFEHMTTGIIVVDENGKVLEMNRSVLPFVKTTKGETFDMDKYLAPVQTQGEVSELLYRYRHHPRDRLQTEITLPENARHVTIQISPVLDDRKTLLGRVITFHDVTELRKLVDEMNRKNEALHERNLELISIQEELFKANQKLEQMAITDGLTGCYNRRYLMQQLEHEVLLNMRYRIPFSIFLFDIDFFKHINDRYGHLTGDEVIRSTADIVRSNLRRTDILARYGGEEFTIYLPHTNREQAETLADRILRAINDNIVTVGTEQVRVTISMGIVTEEGEPFEIDNPKEYLRDLFARADAALYKAKNEGRNRVKLAL